MAERFVTKPVIRAKVVPPRLKALARGRLEELLDHVWDHRIGLVLGPAGSGKTTLLTQFAASAHAPVGWYRADSEDTGPLTLLSHLERSLCSALRGLSGGWLHIDDAIAALEAWPGERALLVIDDLHLLEETPAESSLERILRDAPPSLTMLVAARRPPSFNLSRLRVSGDLLEIGPDDLRFRSWEVEHLFRDFYGEPMPPEDLAALARRTEGWAAGLQLFHLATRGKTPSERRRTLAALATRSRLVREYLTRNVLDELPQELRGFLVGTCALGRLTGPLCDEFLNRTGSGQILAELERSQVFTTALDDEQTYRYHEVLRSHLEATLVEDLGEAGAKACHERAGVLLEAAGSADEALRSYCRAEDWAAVARLLGCEGRQLVEDNGCWIEALPPALVKSEPWLMLAMARRYRGAGRWKLAVDAYQRAEVALHDAPAAETCRSERQAVAAWFDPASVPPPGWAGLALSAVRHDPVTAWRRAAALPGPTGQMAAGLAALLAGHPIDARTLFREVSDSPDASPTLSAGARVAAAQALLYTDQGGDPAEMERAALDAERVGLTWLARVSRAGLALTSRADGVAEASAARLACEQDEDDWGSALAGFFEALGLLAAGECPVGVLETAGCRFGRMGAVVMEAWCRSALAFALARGPDGGAGAREAALEAEIFARAAGVPGAEAMALMGVALVDGGGGTSRLASTRTVNEESGLALAGLVGLAPLPPAPPTSPDHEAPPCPLTLRCFGRFHISVDEHVIDLTSVKPRVRATLRLLAIHAGRPVHRETILEALWPEGDLRGGSRSLHVAISSLRQLLEPSAERGQSALVIREGDAYCLALPPGAHADLVHFEQAVFEARAARVAGDGDRTVAALKRALAAYEGELLPEDGPVEWVVRKREGCRMDAAEAAQMLAECELERGDPVAACAACHRGLQIDRYRDRLWRLLIEASQQAGDHAAAARARRGYDEVLAELDLPPASISEPTGAR